MNQLPLTYLAAPYNHEDLAVMEARLRSINATAAQMLRLGLPVFSPLTHNRPLLETGLVPAGWEFWQPFDELLLGRCDVLCVLKLPGWHQSTGVKGEVEFAGRSGKPISWLHPLGVGCPEMDSIFRATNTVWTLPARNEVLACARHCEGCEGSDHHWVFDTDADQFPDFADTGYMACRHCSAIRQVEEDDE